MMAYISEPKGSTRGLLKLINPKSTKKSLTLLYTNDKEAEKEMRGTSTFTLATNNMKYIVVTLIKKVKKNFRSLKKKLQKIPENGKISHTLL